MELEPASAGRGHNSLRIEVVTSQEQLIHAFAVRSICFLEEGTLSAQQAFDGNDYQATHIIVYAGSEPVGSARLRWFRNFAKMERTAFRKAYRSARILRDCSHFIFDHVSRKGYDQLITHAAPKYALLWQRLLGFERVAGKEPAYIDGQSEPYVELVKYLNVPENAISGDTEAQVLFRIEGAWDEPSQFETVAE